MKNLLFFGGLLTACSVSAQTDTARSVLLREAQVVTNRATKHTPIAFSNIGAKDLERINLGQDLPFLLSTLPSVVVTSDAGTGIGYTSISVRGTDASRINITANGVPLNDPESHTFYWVDIPDFASSVQDLQLQRGAGTSTNGAGAFGASINMQTAATRTKRYAELNASTGSFNTYKTTFRLGSGLLRHHWSFDTRLSYLSSDGYRDRAATDMFSYFTQGTYFADQTSIKLIAFGGKEKTYHAWDGISREQLTTQRTYNPNGFIKDTPTPTFYKDQNDVYFQQHVQAIMNHRFSPTLKWTTTLHYTYGNGYYEEYKNARTLAEYGLQPFTLPDGTLVQKSSLVRRKHLLNHFGGGSTSLNYHLHKLDLTTGAAFNYFRNKHFGNIIWIRNYIGQLSPNQNYYTYMGRKLDANLFLRADYAPLPQLHLFADMQYRHLHYTLIGQNANFDWNRGSMQDLDIHETFNFFNPKAGVTYSFTKQAQAYASLSIAQKEPTNNNYTDGYFTRLPRAERLYDYEIGYRYANKRFELAINGYYMYYKDQLIKTGQVNEIGEAVSENVPESYRLGVELSGAWQISPTLRWEGNTTLSRNKIKHYTAYLLDENWENLKAFDLGTKSIGFSPNITANSRFTFSKKGLVLSLTSQFVGRQYLDNLQLKESSLDAYFVNHLSANYTFKVRGLKELTIGATIYNLFNEKYETNGYSQTTYNSTNGAFQHDPRFYPMAGTNFLCHLAVKF